MPSLMGVSARLNATANGKSRCGNACDTDDPEEDTSRDCSAVRYDNFNY
jgi:hypothetical protein